MQTPIFHDDHSPAALLRRAEPCLWLNPLRRAGVDATQPVAGWRIGLGDTQAAAARLARFAPLLARVFPQLRASAGEIESPLLGAQALRGAVGLEPGQGSLWIKADHRLPVAGSVKARGGIHEVLEFAEGLALRHGLLPGRAQAHDYPALAEEPARALFARHTVAVGSTGNLGLSIGVAAAALGFRAVVHMSADAKEWKKQRLRQCGVQVVEHAGDYEGAVAAGRAQAAGDALCHFVDDERSLSLLLGYSAAAPRLRRQLQEAGIAVDARHPLFVYLPCGVGGAPAGITFGLRHVFGAHAHCFFAEPVQSPCFMAQMMAGPLAHPSVYELGLTNRTEADGLAVPRASLPAAELMGPLLSGCFTVRDQTLFEHLARVLETTGERIEPSAAAGFSGPAMLTQSAPGRRWLAAQGLLEHLPQATHLVWTTGGLLVPPGEFERFVRRASAA